MRYGTILCSVLAAVESCRVFDRHIQSGIDVIYTDMMGGERMMVGDVLGWLCTVDVC